MKLFGQRPGLLESQELAVPLPAQVLSQLKRDVLLFLLVSWLDVLMTYWLLTHQTGIFIESNPAADLVRSQWGFAGMVAYKFLLVGIVVMNSFIIVRYRPEIARRLIQFATLVVNAVVIYSLFLLLIHS